MQRWTVTNCVVYRLLSCLVVFLILLYYCYFSSIDSPANDYEAKLFKSSGMSFKSTCDISSLNNSKHQEICHYIQNNCDPDIFSLSISYYCSDDQSNVFKGSLLVCISLIILLCFAIFGIITSNFLYPNLDTLSYHLKISKRISGLTLLAFGNATPDIFSTYNAMSTNSSSLAIGELIGSANFVICFIIGSMGLIRPFKVNLNEFLKDIGFFATLIILSFYFIYDEKLKNFECILMIVSYIAYVTYSILFTNEGKELEERDDLSVNFMISDDENQLLSPTIEGALDFNDIPRSPVGSCFSKRIGSSLLEDDNKIRGLQKLDIFDSMKVWRSKSSENVEPSLGLNIPHFPSETDSLLSPSFNVKSYSSDGINKLHHQIPKLTLDIQVASSSSNLNNNSPAIEQPIPVRVTAPIPSIIINDQNSNTSLSEILPIERNSSFNKVLNCLIYPLNHEDLNNSFTTILSTPLIILFNFINPTYPIHLLEHSEYSLVSYEEEILYKHKMFKYQCLILPFLFYPFLYPGFPIIYLIAYTIGTTFIINVINDKLYYKYLIPLVGFLTSMIIIIITSTQLIKILKNIGVISHISEGLLGLTILSLGNSTGDLISNLTLARLDLSVVGLNACFGSPLLYILFGIGINGLILNLKHGVSVMILSIDDSFKVSAFGLVVMICFYVIVVPLNNWYIDRRIGFVGVSWWCLITGYNVYNEVYN